MPQEFLDHGRDSDLGDFRLSHDAVIGRTASLRSNGVFRRKADWVAFKFEYLERAHVGKTQGQFANLVLGHRQKLERC